MWPLRVISWLPFRFKFFLNSLSELIAPKVHLPRQLVWLAVSVGLAFVALTVTARPVQAAVYTCDEAGLDSALATGGTATFSCVSPTTIDISGPKTVSNAVTLDGGGLLTISGHDTYRVFIVNAPATFQNLTISHGFFNVTADTDGGSAIKNTSTLTLNNATVSNNSLTTEVTAFGVAILNNAGTLTIANSTVSNNTANTFNSVNGAGISTVGGTLIINNSTIANNSNGTIWAGGVSVVFGGKITVSNSTIASNGAEDVFLGDTVDTTSSYKNSIVGVFASTYGTWQDLGNNIVDQDPLLGPLQDNGGPTETMLPQACSPVINAGDSTDAPTYDQRGSGFPRVQGGALDIGAVESNLLPCLKVDNVTKDEGNSGSTTFTFTVTLSSQSVITATTNYATSNGTATTADNDYTATSGTLTFSPGTTTHTVSVAVLGDTNPEYPETFNLGLSNPMAATIASNGVGTIQNDDIPGLSVSPVSQVETDSGTTSFVFAVTQSDPISQVTSVQYATADGTATTADNDYVATSGTLSFAPGETSKAITVTVNGDTKFEADETFQLNLSNPVSVTLASSTITGTILNDDAASGLIIYDASQVEGNAGSSLFSFNVSLGEVAGLPVTVTYATADDTALAGSDYLAGSGSLVFEPGEITKTVTVEVYGDTLPEPDETFEVTLSDPVNAVLGRASALGTIVNDDLVTPTGLSIAGVTQKEGNSGVTPFDFVVTLNPASNVTVTVQYATADGTARETDPDYQATGGTLTFAPGETTKTVTVAVTGDTTIEPDETFYLNLSDPANSTLAQAQAIGLILDDDYKRKVDLPPADLIGQLRQTPDRVAANDSQNVISYIFTVKNVGPGQAGAVRLTLPVDPNLTLGYTDFPDGRVWVSQVTTNSLTINLPDLPANQVISGTIIFRPQADPVPAVGTVVSGRYTLGWVNLAGDSKQVLSNGVSFSFGPPGSNRDVSGGEIQLLSGGAVDPTTSKAVYHSDFWIPGEAVSAWLTRPDGTSLPLLTGPAGPSGNFQIEVDTAGLAPGTYSVAAYGQRSQEYANAVLVLGPTG